jgi:hypothetical protein
MTFQKLLGHGSHSVILLSRPQEVLGPNLYAQLIHIASLLEKTRQAT